MDIVDLMDRSLLGSCQKCPERTRTTYVLVIPIETALGAASVMSGDVVCSLDKITKIMKLFFKFEAAPEMIISTLKKTSYVKRSLFSLGSSIEIHSFYC